MVLSTIFLRLREIFGDCFNRGDILKNTSENSPQNIWLSSITKSLSVNNISPFVKGGWGDFPKAGQSKSPYVPLFQRGI
jgi:hypothetical protein